MNVTLFNGGRGASTIIKSLKNYKNLKISSVVNAYDDGKSTGEIRFFFDMLGPSDLRKVQSIFLNENDKFFKGNLNLFNYRLPQKISNSSAKKLLKNLFLDQKLNNNNFEIKEEIFFELRLFIKIFLSKLKNLEIQKKRKFNFSDCSIMNCIYAGAYLHLNRDFSKTVKYISDLFGIKNNILPNNNENLKLIALRKNGDVLMTESDIVNLRSNVEIKKIFLIKYKHNLDHRNISKMNFNDKIKYLNKINVSFNLSDSVRKLIKNADIIIFAPGTQHSSLLPTYLSNSLGDTIAKNKKSFKVFITNIGADYENPVYIASDYINNAFKYLCYSSSKSYSLNDFFNLLLINNPAQGISKNKVKFDKKIKDMKINYFKSNFESKQKIGYHDGDKIVKTIFKKFNFFREKS